MLLFFSFKSNAQDTYRSKFYLIDTINISLASDQEKIFIKNSLQAYHTSSNDSIRLSKIKDIVEGVKSPSIWGKYNEYMLMKTDSLLIKSNSRYYEFVKFDALYNKAYYFIESKKYQQAKLFFEKALLQGTKTNNKRLLAKTHMQLGLISKLSKKYPEALTHFKKGLQIQKELNNSKDIGNTYNVIANLYDSQDNHTEALVYYFKSLKIRESIQDKKSISSSLNRIATLYKKQNEPVSALNYYQKSLAIKREINDKKGEATLLNNIGVFYKEKGEYKKALEYYEKSLVIKKILGRKKSSAHTLNNIGTINRYLKNYNEALVYYKESFAISIEQGDKKWQVITLFNMAEAYLMKGNLKQAKKTAETSFDLAQKMERPGLIRDAAKILKEVYKKENNWKEAYIINELFIKLRDSIRNDKTEKGAIKLKAKYDLANKEQEIALLSSKNEVLKKDQEVKQLKLDRNKNSLILFSIALFLALGLAFYAYRSSQKKQMINSLLKREKAIISEQHDAKNMMLQEIHHRVKNNLQVVNSLLRMQSSKIDDGSTVEMFKETQNRVRSMAKLHEKMYQSGDLKNLDAKEHISMLINGIVENYSLETQIELDIDIESFSIDAQTMMPLSLIINEMITNSLKYAFKGDEVGTITVKLNQVEGFNELLVSDNGKGYSDKDMISGLGMKLINSFTKQIRGDLEKKNGSGTFYKLTFPKS